MTTDNTIPLVSDEEASPEVKAVFDRVRSALGFVPNLFRLWAGAPQYLETLVQLEVTIGGSGVIPPYLKELAMVRTSELNGCPYCKAFHGTNLESIGIEERKLAIARTRTPPDPGLFTEEELAVLQLADEMTLNVRAEPETLQRVTALFGREGVVELMATIALLNFDNRMAFSANVPVDDR